MPKTQTPRNSLRPAGNNALVQQYVPFRYADPMMNMVPQLPTGPVVNNVPKSSLLQTLDDVLTGYSVGAGKARVGDYQMIEDLLTRPRGVYNDFVQAARAVAANPGAVVNALKSGAQHAVSSPTAFGEAVGSFGLPKLGKARGLMSELDVYHGTPHTFDPETGAPLGRFRSEKIGTGEGAQAYGHGLYFAENPNVAGEYRSNLSYRNMVQKFRQELPDDADFSDALEWANSKKASPEMAKVIKELNNEDWLGFDYPAQALTALFKEPESFQISDELKQAVQKIRGNVYKVDLPDEKIAQMLDWDKPFFDQPQSIKDLAKNTLPPGVYNRLLTSPTGDFVEALAVYNGGKVKAAALLQQAGIPGIKYLDAASRGAEKKTRNFVVFPGEEQHLNILERK